MTGDPAVHMAARPGSSHFGHAPADVDRPEGVDHRNDLVPRRLANGDPSGFIDAALAAHEAAKGDRTTFVDGEFRELATSVRKWLALSSAKAIPTKNAIDSPDLCVPHTTVPIPIPVQRWKGRQDLVGSERPAVLIDAEHLPSHRLPHLLETVRAAYGSPVICRAYADWTRPELKSWFAHLRQCGVQPIHNFDTRDHSRSLVALALEALDVVERYGVTCAVLVGDLGTALPLVTRLKAAGVKVAVVGPASNPDDVRREADEFLDIASIGDTATRTGARHRA